MMGQVKVNPRRSRKSAAALVGVLWGISFTALATPEEVAPAIEVFEVGERPAADPIDLETPDATPADDAEPSAIDDISVEDAFDAEPEIETEPEIEAGPDRAATEENENAPSAEENDPETSRRAEPAMWRVTDEDSEIWLLGTFHILPPDLDWRSDALARVIDAAETIYFEAEVDTPDAQQRTVKTLMTEGFLPAGGTLSALLDEADAAKLKSAATEVGLPFDAIDTMRPWQAFLAMTVQYIVAKGFDPGSGVETVLLKEARLRGRDLKFFESVDEQLALFTSLDRETELNLLKFTLREWDQQETQLNALLDAWSRGDVDAIDAMMNASMLEDAPAVYDALIVRRNEAWVKEISKLLEGRGKTLIAVGAGHLVGDQSVPALLAAQGASVERYGLEP